MPRPLLGCDKAARLVTDDLTSLQRKPLPGDRLIRAKALVIGELPVRQESYDGLSGQLLAYATTGRPLDQDRISARTQLVATAQRVQAAFARWIRPTGFVRVVEAPAGK